MKTPFLKNPVPATADDAPVDADALLAEFDRESNTRHFSGIPRKLIRYMLAAFTLFVLYMNLIPSWPEQIRRAAFVGLIVFMAFMLFPANRKAPKKPNYIPWYDFVLAIVGAGTYFYFIFNFDALMKRASRIQPLEIVLGIIGILILAEVCRRAVGVPILVVAAAFIGYAFLSGYSLKMIIYHLFYTLEGVFATPIGVCSTFIVLFIILGAFLEKTNIGTFIIDLANSICGFAVGGPAKVAVVASALEGMYSGSSVANTVGSGSVTIPIMKKTGYPPEFAAAVEAAASTGGQIMPPVMGAAAFLMAEFTETPYATIAVCAIFPAVLYFTGIFIMIHLRAKKLGLKGIPRDQIPNFFKLILKKGYLLLPIVILVLLMSAGRTPAFSAIMAIVSAIVLSFFSKDTRLTPVTFVDALENGGKNTIGVAIACGIAGIIVGVVSLSGIGIKLADTLLAASGGITIIALFLTMIACIILGMGVPTTANYVIMATICAPILVKMGIPLIAAHMFVFYFGIVADITPPVALAAYAGAAIAKSNPLKTAVTASRLAIAVFIIPYIFALNPAMLFIDTNVVQVVQIVITSLIGIYALSAALEGYLFRPLSMWKRLLIAAAGIALIDPQLITDLIGIAVIGVIAIVEYLAFKRIPAKS
ncbi:MAG: TRAP transporter permease [Clostridiales bacterium]|nr:TRAP transporter permease [Clostridiales bacterium]